MSNFHLAILIFGVTEFGVAPFNICILIYSDKLLPKFGQRWTYISRVVGVFELSAFDILVVPGSTDFAKDIFLEQPFWQLFLIYFTEAIAAVW